MFAELKKTLTTASPERVRLLQKWVAYGTLIGMIFAAVVWFSPIADRWHATEPEVDTKVELSMDQHMIEQQSVPYAMKNDVTHQGNIRIDEKILKAKSEITDYEDGLDLNQYSIGEQAIVTRKIQRLKEEIEVWKSRYEPEPGALHTHGR